MEISRWLPLARCEGKLARELRPGAERQHCNNKAILPILSAPGQAQLQHHRYLSRSDNTVSQSDIEDIDVFVDFILFSPATAVLAHSALH